MERTVKAAAVYVRISQDRGGEGLGVARQERLCRDLAARKGWPVAEVYCDNDRSAYTGKPRPAYGRMCDDLAAGVRDAVLVVDTDRLTRHLRELETFIELANKHDVALANVSGDVDLSTSDGRFRARILGVVARHESEKKSERIRRQREQAALAGRPHPGPRVFGYEPDGVTIRESEAALIRNAAVDILDGRSIRSVADQWNRLGVTTARGNAWSVNSVRDVLTRQRNIGKRRHQGEVIGAAEWPAILDDDTFERICALARARRRRTGRPATRVLSAIVTCSICDGPMHASTDHGKAVYACRRAPGYKDENCGRLSIVADPVDDFIRDVILAAVEEGDLAERIEAKRGNRSHRDLTAGLRADEQALEQLTIEYAVERIHTKAGYLKARRQLEDRIARVRAQIEALAASDALAGMPADRAALRGWWHAPSTMVADRRQLVKRLIVKVPILPRKPRLPRQFDPERVDVEGIIWRV